MKFTYDQALSASVAQSLIELIVRAGEIRDAAGRLENALIEAESAQHHGGCAT
jgi:hypothetical protein